MTNKYRKNSKNSEFSCFEVLDVLFDAKASPVAWASFMEA